MDQQPELGAHAAMSSRLPRGNSFHLSATTRNALFDLKHQSTAMSHPHCPTEHYQLVGCCRFVDRLAKFEDAKERVPSVQ